MDSVYSQYKEASRFALALYNTDFGRRREVDAFFSALDYSVDDYAREVEYWYARHVEFRAMLDSMLSGVSPSRTSWVF